MAKKVIAMLLVIAMLCVPLMSCKKDSGKSNSTTVATQGSSDPLDPMIEAKDYEGRVFDILSHREASYKADEFLGTVINDAVYTRNDMLENKYNIDINFVHIDTTKYVSNIRTIVNAPPEDVPEVITPADAYAFQLGNEGFLYEITDVPHINLSKPYWFQNVVGDASINNRSYFGVSDACISSFEEVPVMMFNKDIAEDLKMDNFYEIVENGEWYFDTFYEFSKAAYSDITGDGVSPDDQYGLTGNSYMSECFVYGGGFNFVPKDANDLPYLNIEGNERFQNYFSDIQELVNDSTTYYGEYQTGSNARINAPVEAFEGGRVLFWVDSVVYVKELRLTDVEFGLLPLPKVDDLQEEHTNTLHG